MRAIRRWLDRWQLATWRAVVEFADDRGHRDAAQIGFFALLGAVPLGLLLVGVAGLIFDEQELRERVVDAVFDNVPLSTDEDRRQLEDAVTEALANAGDLHVFPIVLLIFAATGVMAALRHAINEAWDIHERPPLLRRKALDLALVVLAIGVIALAVWLPGSGDFPFVFTALTLTFLYRVLPMTRPRLREVVPGAIIAAALISLVRELLELYFEQFADMGAIYGSLGALMAFLLFVFAASNIVVYGAEFASEYARLPADEEVARIARDQRRRITRRRRASGSSQPAR